jgi:hypothetical protein
LFYAFVYIVRDKDKVSQREREIERETLKQTKRGIEINREAKEERDI